MYHCAFQPVFEDTKEANNQAFEKKIPKSVFCPITAKIFRILIFLS
ncbi:hypothetical protein CCAN11_1730010 [Capnocytophaga canimorsus]|uniref:Uncharacterized protein n=1 Tax=Capnocytophaga canimorsus TaxID=28188 RepID=A0A0B7I925_9FLAO|nr:hypothetical protein CCAN11_1730010 [Capnocytophaga canimorsus]